MKIKSKWKDYYDYISYRYGEDDTRVYVRKDFSEKYEPIVVPNPDGAFSGTYSFDDTRGNNHTQHWRWLIVGRYSIPLWGDGIFRPELHAKFLKKPWGGGSPLPRPQSTEQVERLIKCVGAPVFVCSPGREYNTLDVENHIPRLAELGVPAVYPAEQVWQSIYSSLNLLYPNPDVEPPVTLSNDDRIHAAGFDLKTSFRNPIKLSKIKS